MKKLAALLALPFFYTSAYSAECTVKDIAEKVIESPNSRYPSPRDYSPKYEKYFQIGGNRLKVSVVDREPSGVGAEDLVEILVEGEGSLKKGRFEIDNLEKLSGGHYIHYVNQEGFQKAYRDTIKQLCNNLR